MMPMMTTPVLPQSSYMGEESNHATFDQSVND